MPREVVSRKDWHEWKQSPVTRALFHDLNAIREETKESIADGHASNDQLQSMIGVCQGLKQALEYAAHTFEVIQLEEDNATTTD